MTAADAGRQGRRPTRTRPPACGQQAPVHTLRSNPLKQIYLKHTPFFIFSNPPRYIYFWKTQMQTSVLTTKIVDYAYPAMMAERALKRLHEAALNKDYEAAMDEVVKAIEQMQYLHTALWVMQDREESRK